MERIEDVAEYILGRLGYMPSMKLHKLIYYSHLYSLCTLGKPLTADTITACPSGPKYESLIAKQGGQWILGPKDIESEPHFLDQESQMCVDAILAELGPYTGRQLSDFTMSDQFYIKKIGAVITDQDIIKQFTPAFGLQ